MEEVLVRGTPRRVKRGSRPSTPSRFLNTTPHDKKREMEGRARRAALAEKNSRSAVKRKEQLAILALERRDRQLKDINDARSSIADRQELAAIRKKSAQVDKEAVTQSLQHATSHMSQTKSHKRKRQDKETTEKLEEHTVQHETSAAFRASEKRRRRASLAFRRDETKLMRQMDHADREIEAVREKQELEVKESERDDVEQARRAERAARRQSMAFRRAHARHGRTLDALEKREALRRQEAERADHEQERKDTQEMRDEQKKEKLHDEFHGNGGWE